MKTTWVDHALERVFPKKTHRERLADEAERTELELQQARSVIHQHKFLEHMAQRKLDALHEWNTKEMQ